MLKRHHMSHFSQYIQVSSKLKSNKNIHCVELEYVGLDTLKGKLINQKKVRGLKRWFNLIQTSITPSSSCHQ